MRVPACRFLFVVALCLALPVAAFAQSGGLAGMVHDETGGVLPGVQIEVRAADGTRRDTQSDDSGAYRVDRLVPGVAEVSFELVNFARVTRNVVVKDAEIRLDAILHLALSADVTVTGTGAFTNLADAEDPAASLVGIAQAASQGAITARQLEARPIMRAGEVLETVPGVIISQHSGEGKANQYYLRGFNLDHGTDFATTVAGMPVNMPTHGHGHGYSDLNFLIPELVGGVQFSKGPYSAEQGDFATAGAANVSYVTALDTPIVSATGGGQGYARLLAAAAPRVGRGRLLGAVEVQHNDGPWTRPDDYEKVNGVLRYSRGDRVNGLSVTGMLYRATWNATDQVPARAIADGRIDRFGNLDATDGGNTYRFSGSMEWQRTRGRSAWNVTAFGIGYDLDLFSNFTFFLDDPVNGDQFHQADNRFVMGGKVSYRRIGRLAGRPTENTVGVELRHDDIGPIGLYHTSARRLVNPVREDAVVQTSAGVFAQNETAWRPWLRTLAGIRLDGYRFDVHAGEPANAGVDNAGLVSPKGGVVFGPWSGAEFYVNAGLGFHSNDARGATITVDPATGDPAERVTPLVRARGAEVGARVVSVPHLQSSVAVWTLDFDSELVFVGDAGTTEAGRPSHRYGVEWANYYSPRPWLTIDADVSLSSSHFTDADPAGDEIPGAVATVVSGGVTIDALGPWSGSLRWRYFGPRPLIEDGSVHSEATSLVNLQAGYALTRALRLQVDVFNVFDARDSDIDYFYASRLPGEPAGGIDDIHLHPVLPRTARIGIRVGF